MVFPIEIVRFWSSFPLTKWMKILSPKGLGYVRGASLTSRDLPASILFDMRCSHRLHLPCWTSENEKVYPTEWSKPDFSMEKNYRNSLGGKCNFNRELFVLPPFLEEKSSISDGIVAVWSLTLKQVSSNSHWRNRWGPQRNTQEFRKLI